MTSPAAPVWRPSVEIDLDALCANFRALHAASPGAAPAAVVKCDGYGLGAQPIAAALALKEGCNAFFVAYPEEGVAVRAALDDVGAAAAIYVFNGPRVETLALFDRAHLIPVLNSLDDARLWTTNRPGAAASLHVDTGMNRLGATYAELSDIAALKDLRIDLLVSHLACSAAPAHPLNARQLDAFAKAATLFPGAPRSFAASAGALLPAPYHHDLTRLGIAMYGGSPLDEGTDARLRPVARLTAPVAQLRMARKGESVGYGATHEFASDRRLAIVQLGYGDGFPRVGSNRASAQIGSARAAIVGRVSMDYIALDVTETPEPVHIGDRAEFFGPALPIEEAAAACMTVPYEMLTGLGARVLRRYLFKDAPAKWRAPESGGAQP